MFVCLVIMMENAEAQHELVESQKYIINSRFPVLYGK